MQLYLFEYTTYVIDPVSGRPVRELTVHKKEWFGSERAAVVRRLELFKADLLCGKKKDNEIWPVEVPTRKADLLAWLNENAV